MNSVKGVAERSCLNAADVAMRLRRLREVIREGVRSGNACATEPRDWVKDR